MDKRQNNLDDYYNHYNEKSGNGPVFVGIVIIGIIFTIVAIGILISEGNIVPLIIECIYIAIASWYLYDKNKNSKISDDFVPSNKSKEELMDEYVVKHERKLELEKQVEIAHINAIVESILCRPKCPTCGSANVKKLGTFYSTGFTPKYFKCNNCGYMW